MEHPMSARDPGGHAACGMARSTSSREQTNQRCADPETVADKMRAVPFVESAAPACRVGSVRAYHAETGRIASSRRSGSPSRPNRKESRRSPRSLTFGKRLAYPSATFTQLLEVSERPVQVVERSLINAFGEVAPAAGWGLFLLATFHSFCRSMPKFSLALDHGITPPAPWPHPSSHKKPGTRPHASGGFAPAPG